MKPFHIPSLGIPSSYCRRAPADSGSSRTARNCSDPGSLGWSLLLRCRIPFGPELCLCVGKWKMESHWNRGWSSATDYDGAGIKYLKIKSSGSQNFPACSKMSQQIWHTGGLSKLKINPGLKAMNLLRNQLIYFWYHHCFVWFCSVYARQSPVKTID